MKNDWLSIPDAPNYEINSQLVMRNRRTKKILAAYTDYKNFKYYSLRVSWRTGTVKRSPKTFRAQAEAATVKGTFKPILSLGGRYEINKHGVVRNARTKRVLKSVRNGKVIKFGCNSEYSSRAVADLLWEVHGQIIKRRYRPQPCFIENAHGKIFFPHLRACARYLAPKISYAVLTVASWLGKRREQIAEWKISYPPKDLSGDVKWNLKGLTALARRQAKCERIIQNGLR